MILHHISNFATRGGAEMMLARLLNALPEEQFLLVSLTGVSDDLSELLHRDNVECIALGASNPVGMMGAARTLATLIRDRRPDAVMGWMYHANLVASVAARLARRDNPLIWNIRQSLDSPATLSKSSRLALRGNRMLSRGPDAIAFAGSRARDMHRAYGLRNDRMVVLPNGYTLPTDIGARTGPPRVLGAAGRLHPQKDFPGLLKAAAMVLRARPDTQLRLAGRGLDLANPDFKAMVDASGIPVAQIIALGEVSEMSFFYAGLDVFVLGSRTEGFPNVLAEAMSYGVPCVTTDVGDAAQIVDGTGISVPPGAPAALAQAISQMLDVPDYAERSTQARAKIEAAYRMETVAAQYQTLWRDPASWAEQQ